jgi:hypothetical protein
VHNGELAWELPWGPVDAGTANCYVTLGLGGDGTIYAVAIDGTLRAVTPRGIEKWAVWIDASATAPVIDASGMIFELGLLGLYAFTPDGQEAWLFPLQEATMGSLAMAADGTLLVSTARTYAIGEAP